MKQLELQTLDLCKLAMHLGIEKKAYRPLLIDLKGQNTLVDYFVLLSANNTRQVLAISEYIRLFFKQELGVSTLSMDGLDSGHWVLLDFGNFFVHVFLESTREMYRLEELWNKARFINVVPEDAMNVFNSITINKSTAIEVSPEL